MSTGAVKAHWKDQYFDLFKEQPPSPDECAAYFESLFETECDIAHAADNIGIALEDNVDQHTFSALGHYFSKGEESCIWLCRIRCLATCSQCKSLRPTWMFTVSEKYTMSPNCNECRGDETKVLFASQVTYIIDVDILDDKICSDRVNAIEKILIENHEAARNLNMPMDGMVWGKNIPVIFKAVGEINGTALVSAAFMRMLEGVEPYRYYSNGGNGNNFKRFVCSHSYRGQKEPPEKRRRVKDSKRRHLCGGSVSFSFASSTKRIVLKHYAHHDIIEDNRELSEDAAKRIKELSSSGMSPFQILNMIRAEGWEMILYNSVYNTWLATISDRFRRHQDPVQSTVVYLKESEEIETLCMQDAPLGIGMITTLGREIVDNWRVEELFIDSTFKTNNSRLELFAVIASCMGVGFPIAYFFWRPGLEMDLNQERNHLHFSCLT